MLSFILAIVFLLTTPGPGVLSTAGVGAAFGYKPGLRYVFGLFIGTNLVALAVVTGLAAAILATPAIRNILLLVSALYLLYLAFRIAFAGSTIAFIEAREKPGIVAGILLQTINPKAYAVNTTLFTGFAFYSDSLLLETVLKFIIINAIWIPVHLLWLLAGSSIKQLNLRPNTQFAINVLMALAMLSVVFLAAFSVI